MADVERVPARQLDIRPILAARCYLHCALGELTHIYLCQDTHTLTAYAQIGFAASSAILVMTYAP